MSDDGAGRVALVTGGARGIGLACALALRDAGHRVAVTYRSSPPEAAGEAGLLAVPCNVTDGADVDGAFEAVEGTLGPVEVLVSNAGITRDSLLLRMSEEDFAAVLDTNLTGGYRVLRRGVRSMMRARWGRVILVSSVVGLGGQAGQANYAASKAGLVGLARSVAKEFAGRNVTVNVVAPGPIETDMIDALSHKRQEEIRSAVPLGRFGTTAEVAATVCFLVSPEAGYITGAVIPVDGGLSMS
ncbi:MAG: 3-oxoacyl-ACP reductase FabG [bacterium]|nr:3-oxoacyl-ACP reductase FabG [bacterium]MCY3951980.1 3-oxoacyl-ACP reductase FabG [bacterium]